MQPVLHPLQPPVQVLPQEPVHELPQVVEQLPPQVLVQVEVQEHPTTIIFRVLVIVLLF